MLLISLQTFSTPPPPLPLKKRKKTLMIIINRFDNNNRKINNVMCITKAINIDSYQADLKVFIQH